MADSHKHKNEPTGSINSGKFPDQLSAWHLLKEDFMEVACYLVKQSPHCKTKVTFTVKRGLLSYKSPESHIQFSHYNLYNVHKSLPLGPTKNTPEFSLDFRTVSLRTILLLSLRQILSLPSDIYPTN
jgi:hypothetical protein